MNKRFYLNPQVPELQKHNLFVNPDYFGIQIWQKKHVNYDKFEIATNCVNQIFNLNAFFFFLFTGATWYYHTICLVITYFASFTDYEDDIFEVISNWHVQGSKFGGKINKFGVKSKKKSWTSRISWISFFPGLASSINTAQRWEQLYCQTAVWPFEP